jgi:two-component system cell cycle sensor histidine kinase/response regulator CckA
MEPEVLERIFDPYFTTKSTGNGLGLSAVYGIVQRHRGAVTTTSTPGKGTTFRLELPAIPRRAEVLGERTELPVRGGTEMILFADDEEPIRIVVEDMLTALGYRVVLAKDGEEAVRILRDRPQSIDLALLDIAMPNLNGQAAANAMRLIRPDLRIILTSGHCDREQVEIFESEGFHEFLPKPYAMVELQAHIRRVLDTVPDFRAH